MSTASFESLMRSFDVHVNCLCPAARQILDFFLLTHVVVDITCGCLSCHSHWGWRDRLSTPQVRRLHQRPPAGTSEEEGLHTCPLPHILRGGFLATSSRGTSVEEGLHLRLSSTHCRFVPRRERGKPSPSQLPRLPRRRKDRPSSSQTSACTSEEEGQALLLTMPESTSEEEGQALLLAMSVCTSCP